MRSPNRPPACTNFSVCKPASSAKTVSLLTTNLSIILKPEGSALLPAKLLLEAMANQARTQALRQAATKPCSVIFWQREGRGGGGEIAVCFLLSLLLWLLLKPGYIMLNFRLFLVAR